jgi:hypothetical protein
VSIEAFNCTLSTPDEEQLESMLMATSARRLIVVLCAAASAAMATAVAPAQTVAASQMCEVDVSGGDFKWRLNSPKGEELMGGDTTAVSVGGSWWATSNSTHKLVMVGTTPVSGTDAIGAFVGVRVRWTAGDTPWETTCKGYADVGGDSGGAAAVFTSSFPRGAEGTAVPTASSSDGVLSNWPLARTIALGFSSVLSWQGEFCGHTSAVT